MTLRVAVPNKGALSEASLHILTEAGYRKRADSKDLIVYDTANDIEFFYLRPRDIAIYVGNGILDVGITGRDLVIDSGAPVIEKLGLGFARSTFRFAAPHDHTLVQESNDNASYVQKLQGLRIATSYPRLVTEYLQKNNVSAQLVPLDGAVEISIQLGVADVIADVVESGRSLKQNNLSPFGQIVCHSEAVLIERPSAEPNKTKEQLFKRLQGVVFAQRYVMLDYDCPQAILAQATAITPGLESPTIAPLTDPSWVAVRVMVERKKVNDVMDTLAEAGAKAILVSDIRTCRV